MYVDAIQRQGKDHQGCNIVLSSTSSLVSFPIQFSPAPIMISAARSRSRNEATYA